MSRQSFTVTNLDQDETVVLFPSLGHQTRDGGMWNIQVHGEVFSHGSRVGLTKRFLLRMLKRAMKAGDTDLVSPIFQQRIARFLASDEAGKQIAIRVGRQIHVLPKKSRRNGHFSGILRLTSAELAALQDATGTNRLTLDVCGPEGNALPVQGQVHLIGQQGWSVISDIDDTLKHSHVGCRRTLLRNTFLQQFEPVAGMAELYRQWADLGAAFHYVSSCPWQLYRHVSEHLTEVGCPAGSYHLRSFRLRDHLIGRLLRMRRSGKSSVIFRILKTFPQRKFILVGDSGEFDPEIYGAAARRFPEQVERILIRRIPKRDEPADRIERAFRRLPGGMVQLFDDPAELSAGVEPLLSSRTEQCSARS